MQHGGEAFAALGIGKSGGTRLFGVSGHVNRPGVYEKPVAYNLKKLIMEDAGGILGGRKLKAVIPGGSSAPVLAAHEIDISMEFDAVKAAGSMSGSGGVIVFDESTCMVRALARLARFYAEESCGQCTPCREGTNWMEGMLERIEAGARRGRRRGAASSRWPTPSPATPSARWATPPPCRSSPS